MSGSTCKGNAGALSQRPAARLQRGEENKGSLGGKAQRGSGSAGPWDCEAHASRGRRSQDAQFSSALEKFPKSPNCQLSVPGREGTAAWVGGDRDRSGRPLGGGGPVPPLHARHAP